MDIQFEKIYEQFLKMYLYIFALSREDPHLAERISLRKHFSKQ